jgi:hypothetical protein
MKSSGSREGAVERISGPLTAILVFAAVLALVPASPAVPMENGPQAKIPEVDEAACRANMQAIAEAEESYFAEYGTYTLPTLLAESGVLPGATSLVCPYDGSAYTVTASPESFDVTCMCPHSHGRVVDGTLSWEETPPEP